ncbi:MAG: hypothetical protein IAF58_20385 [Leptolyngbya sp.]|nr:hypothetical protein [Candidatus Melainabacteria bacterium]
MTLISKIAASFALIWLCHSFALPLCAHAKEPENARKSPDVSHQIRQSEPASGTASGGNHLTADEVRAQLSVIRRSETADANNQHNLRVIDNVLGKAFEILGLALGVAIIVSSVIEQRGKKEEVASIVAGTILIMLALIAPLAVHALCEQLAHGIFR